VEGFFVFLLLALGFLAAKETKPTTLNRRITITELKD